jgi:phosphoribosylformimino-5-aminoimidazole carboxamide ribotide isomerase
MMRCILACDLMGGVVVRGVRGERDRYRPISEYSKVVATSAPEDVIRAIRPRETYIADLDRIAGKGDHLQVISRLSGMTRTMVDAGAAVPEDVSSLRKVCHSVILGTETASLDLIREYHSSNVVVSVDMRDGRMMAADPALRVSPLEVVRMLDEIALDSIILLDVARVGSGEGIDFALLEAAASESRHQIIAGGGVRDMEDLDRIGKAGGAGAIIASAVHSGRIPLDVLR